MLWTPELTDAAVKAYIVTARGHRWVTEDRKYHRCTVGKGAGDNHGQAVEFFQASNDGTAGDPWCMDYGNAMGQLALDKAWPLPKTGGVQWMHDWARNRERGLGIDLIFTTPEVGDLMFVWETSLAPPRFGHVTIVNAAQASYELAVPWTIKRDADNRLFTVEGNTNDGGSRDGWGVFQRYRTVESSYRFFRWKLLLGRYSLGGKI